MIKTNRLLGGILLVAGTSIGAGMLALPVMTSFAGFIPSFFTLTFCWLFMFITAHLILEVNLACPSDANMITMAGRTLGATGKIACWIVYLLLLYSLTAAYIAGCAPLFLHLMKSFGWQLPEWTGPFPLLILFGFFVYFGTRTVDYVNRLLMIGLGVAYFALILFLPSHVDFKLLSHIDFSAAWTAIPVIFTSYGFHIVIPSLSTYLDHDAKKLRVAILIGSLIPLFVYLAWVFLVLGTVPLLNLHTAWEKGQPATIPLTVILASPWISTIAGAFAFFAMITSFLGVSLSLSDFLGDGLKLHRFSWGRELACVITFFPPVVFVLTYTRGFLLALQYAGLFVAILLGVLPALMAWTLPKYKRPVMRAILSMIVLISLFVGVFSCLI
jgi:tyrosine-specific transport protein